MRGGLPTTNHRILEAELPRRKADRKSSLAPEELCIRPSAARVVPGGGGGASTGRKLRADFFKARGLGRAPGTWFLEIGVLLISNSQGWMCCGAGRLLV